MRMSKPKLGCGIVLVMAALAVPGLASAASRGKLDVKVDNLANGQAIDGQYAFCVPAQQGHVTLGPDRNPKVSWSGAPSGTKSYAIVVYDPDVPSVATNVNKEGKTLSKRLKRTRFVHWVLVDIPANVTAIDEGADSDKVTPHGKPPGPAKVGVRGINSYTDWFAKDDSMKGDYAGYDGPCPPWNDALVHHYHFVVYALDVPSLGLKDKFTAADARKAMKGHILAEGQVVGTYALNPKTMKTSAAR